jgi:hypothetical protein
MHVLPFVRYMHGSEAKECLTMRSKIISIALLVCLSAVPAAQAAPHHGPKPGHFPGPPPQAAPHPGPKPGHFPGPPPQPPRPIYRPYPRPYYAPWRYPYPVYRNYRYYRSNDIWVSLGAGLLLGSIISSANRAPQYSPPVTGTDRGSGSYSYSGSYDREYDISLIRSSAGEKAKAEASRAAKMASEYGPAQAAALLAKSWEGEGRKTALDTSAGLPVLKVTGFYDGSRITYTFLPDNRKVYVRISLPDYSISVEEGDYYTRAADQPVSAQPAEAIRRVPALPVYTNASMAVQQQDGTLLSAGFGLNRSARNPSGYLIIGEVAKGTAAYYAGVRPGDVLLSVDVYETRNFDAAWFDNYISEKHRSRSLITLSISRNGAEKKLDIQL